MAIPTRPAHMCAEVYDKIRDDDVSEALKAAVVTMCAACGEELGIHADTVQSVFNAFSKQNSATGSPIDLMDGEIVGHVKLLSAIASHLSSRLGLDRSRVEELFRWLSEDGSPSEREEALDWLEDLAIRLDEGGNLFRIAGPTCWLFRDEAGWDANVLFETSAECLPCRLGLPALLEHMPVYPSKLEFLGLCIEGQRIQKPRAATVFHGDYVTVRDIWIPGGFTQPIPVGPPHCVAMGGVREFVGDAPSFSDIEPFVRILIT